MTDIMKWNDKWYKEVPEEQEGSCGGGVRPGGYGGLPRLPVAGPEAHMRRGVLRQDF